MKGRLALALGGGFILVSAAVMASLTHALDVATAAAVAAHRNVALSHIAVNLTSLGSDPVVILAVLVAVCYAAAAGHRARIFYLVAAPAAAFLTDELAKLLVHHPRPPDAIIAAPASFGFPSGHAAAAAAVYLTLALVATRSETRWNVRRLVVAAGLAVAVLVAWSRVYLGVHYLSDVIGGLLLGWAWAVGLGRMTGTA